MLTARTIALALTPALLPSLALAQQTTIIAHTGDPVPGGNGIFASFINDPIDPDSEQAFGPSLNDAGEVAFAGFLGETAGGGSDNSGIYLYDGSGIVEVVREGQVPPDGDGVFNHFNTYTIPTLSDTGTVAFASALLQSMSGEFFEWGIYVYESGTLTQLIRQGDDSPDGDSTIQFVFQPSLNETGQIAFTGEFEAVDPLGERGLFRGDLGTDQVTVLAREEDPVPGGGSFDLITGGALNDAGQVAFNAAIGHQGDRGVFRAEPDGTITLVARIGDPSPDSGESFQSFNSEGYESINEAGDVAFGAYLTTTAAGGAPTSAGIYRFEDGTIVPLARTGQAGPNGGTFVGFALPGHLTVAPTLDDAGQAAFYGYIDHGGLVYGGIFRCDGTTAGMTEVVRQQQPSPDGNGFFQLDSYNGFFQSNDAPKMNEAGQVAFFTNLYGSANGVLQNAGIFFYDDDLGLMKVARKGDRFLGSTITQLRFTPRGSLAHDNDRSGLNDLGQVAYAFELADGTGGIAVWSPPGLAVPGDLNGDGHVTVTDFLLLLAAWGPCPDGCPPSCPGDIDGDCSVGVQDFLLLLANWG